MVAGLCPQTSGVAQPTPPATAAYQQPAIVDEAIPPAINIPPAMCRHHFFALPALRRAIATAWALGLPARISVLMLFEMVLRLPPLPRGILDAQREDREPYERHGGSAGNRGRSRRTQLGIQLPERRLVVDEQPRVGDNLAGADI